MTKLPDKMTNGEAYDPAMLITDQADAAEYFEALVERHMRITSDPRSIAEDIVRQNLGYWAGYYDREIRARVEQLYGCEHPYLGKVERNLTPEQVFEIGLDLGKL